MEEIQKAEPKYGEKIINEFDVERDLEIWENKQSRDYKIKITLPEFCCLCPRSGYPDFATIYLEYIPNKFVVELKAIKLYINSFMSRNISHEDSINEIYSVLERKLDPKWMKITGDFNPRGNVHTVIEICSQSVLKELTPEPALSPVSAPTPQIAPAFERRERSERSFGDRNKDGDKRGGRRSGSDSRSSDRGEKRGSSDRGGRGFDRGDKSGDKAGGERARRAPAKKEGFKKPEFSGEKRARVVKKDK